jgi:putative Holliday junction resolvase
MSDHVPWPPTGRILAFDWGAARIGVALSDPTRTLATPRPAIVEKDKARQIQRACATVIDSEAVAVLVGLPLHLDGASGPSVRSATMFAEKLRAALATACPDAAPAVHLVDERFTSQTAAELLAQGRQHRAPLRKDGTLDSAAAAVLLQACLDTTPGAP